MVIANSPKLNIHLYNHFVTFTSLRLEWLGDRLLMHILPTLEGDYIVHFLKKSTKFLYDILLLVLIMNFC